MKYRAFWKWTWYECEDYGALCRCLSWVGAKSFTCVHATVSDIQSRELVTIPSVIIYEFED